MAKRVIVIASIGQWTRAEATRPFWNRELRREVLPEHRVRKLIGTWWIRGASKAFIDILNALHDGSLKVRDPLRVHIGKGFAEYLDIPLGDVRRQRERSRVWSPVEFDLRHPARACNDRAYPDVAAK